MRFQVIDLNVEKVRAQLADELSRPVSDIEVFVWLRRSGLVRFNDVWMTDMSVLDRLHPILRDIPGVLANADCIDSDQASEERRYHRHR